MKKGIFTTLVVFWCGLIFWFSAQPAVESAKMSHSVGKVIGEVLVPDFKTLSAEEQEKIAEKIDYPIRKTAHTMEYAVLGGLLVLMYGSYGIIGKKGMAYGILTGVAYAMTDEIHQLFVPGTKHEDVCEKENSFCKADNEAEAGVCQKELAVVCDFFNASSSFDDYF